MSDYCLRDRIIALGFDYPSKYTAWALGSLIRDKWVKHPLSGGRLPEKHFKPRKGNR